MQNKSYVYILTNRHRTVLYIGVTSDLKRRVHEHRKRSVSNFTKKYNVKYLVYYETFEEVVGAIQREKVLKGKTRKKKEALINKLNPVWRDLSSDFL